MDEFETLGRDSASIWYLRLFYSLKKGMHLFSLNGYY